MATRDRCKTHIRLWDASTGKTLRTLDSRVAPVEDIVVETHAYIPYLDEFSEDMPGRRVVAGLLAGWQTARFGKSRGLRQPMGPGVGKETDDGPTA